MIIHDHKLSQKQERQAEKAVGETVCLSPLKNKETCIRWNSMTDKERDKEDEIIKAETPSTEYTLAAIWIIRQMTSRRSTRPGMVQKEISIIWSVKKDLTVYLRRERHFAWN